MLEQRLLPLLWSEQGGEAAAGGAAPPDVGAGQQSPEISTRGVFLFVEGEKKRNQAFCWIIRIILEGEARCRLHRKSLNEYNKKVCWPAELTPLYLFRTVKAEWPQCRRCQALSYWGSGSLE
jgi:hypothetical protein